MWKVFLLVLFFLIVACGPRHVVTDRRISPPEKQEVKREKSVPETKIEKRESKEVQFGVASWYGGEFHGRPTSSGEVYDMYQLTCAHNTLPLGTVVMVTNLENGRSLELKVNDRGPFVKERILDVSYAAAQMLGEVAEDVGVDLTDHAVGVDLDAGSGRLRQQGGSRKQSVQEHDI